MRFAGYAGRRFKERTMTHKEKKGHIRAFMQNHYTDERLAQLLAHAQDGKLNYVSCCCFIGVVTADHAVQEGFPAIGNIGTTVDHYWAAKRLPGAQEAESSYGGLIHKKDGGSDDARGP